MPITQPTKVTNRDSGELFDDQSNSISSKNINSNSVDNISTDLGAVVDLTPYALKSNLDNVTTDIHGYYGLLTSFYFGGSPTSTEIDVASVDTWLDVELSIDASGTFDKRPLDMKTSFPAGHSGDGSVGNPIICSLERLDINAFANFRASMAFEPDEDEGQLESRLLFTRHTGTSPSNDFDISEVSLSMQNGANKDYASEPMLSFFIGDTIDTNGAGDAGTCRFQIKSNVAGTVKLRALTWYINK